MSPAHCMSLPQVCVAASLFCRNIFVVQFPNREVMAFLLPLAYSDAMLCVAMMLMFLNSLETLKNPMSFRRMPGLTSTIS